MILIFMQLIYALKGNKLVLTSITGKQSWELDKKSLVYRDTEWGEDKDEVVDCGPGTREIKDNLHVLWSRIFFIEVFIRLCFAVSPSDVVNGLLLHRWELLVVEGRFQSVFEAGLVLCVPHNFQRAWSFEDSGCRAGR